jgi:hypothetical protein
MNETNLGKIVVGGNHKDIIYEIMPNGCHEVTSHAANPHGYYKIRIGKKTHDIHRWLYQQETGIDLKGLDVRHKCDNNKCINMQHLEHGTRKDNVNDMVERNRQYSIVTPDIVKEIIQLHKTGLTTIDIGNRFNINRTTVSSIVNGVTWSHITGIKYANKHRKSTPHLRYIIFDKATQKWRVMIDDGKIRKSLGRYITQEEAIIVRDRYLNIS